MSRFRETSAFGAEEVRCFLEAVDRHLEHPVDVHLIGGSAAALAHGATSTSTDIDTFTAVTRELEAAVARAVEETGLDIPFSCSTVADVPYNYEDRLERHLPELAKLRVWVLERHDLVLSKTVRCFSHDLQQIQEIHAHAPLSFDLLVERFRGEMDHAVGDPQRLRANFLLMIGDVFGELRQRMAERALPEPKR